MITIENRDDYITMTRLLRKSRTDNIRIKIKGSEYIWVKNEFTKERERTIHDLQISTCRYINNCAIFARVMPLSKKEQVNDARKFVESTRLFVNLVKKRG